MKTSYLDFTLSRKAMLCTDQTMRFYTKTLGKFIEWLLQGDISNPIDITSKHVRTFLTYHKERGCSDSYIHTFARSIRTYLRFLFEEGYIQKEITFKMPRIAQKHLPVVSVEEIQTILTASCAIK